MGRVRPGASVRRLEAHMLDGRTGWRADLSAPLTRSSEHSACAERCVAASRDAQIPRSAPRALFAAVADLGDGARIARVRVSPFLAPIIQRAHPATPPDTTPITAPRSRFLFVKIAIGSGVTHISRTPRMSAARLIGPGRRGLVARGEGPALISACSCARVRSVEGGA